MKSTAAVVHEVGKPIEIEEVTLDKPREGEVLIRFTHAGLCHSDPAAPRPRGSIGVSLPGVEVRIVDLNDHTREVGAGTPGELLVRGPLVMLGYHGNPEATAEVLDADGWLSTGDIATKSASGHLFVVDRRKDMIITGGYNVYPAEIERVLSLDPPMGRLAELAS